MMQTRSALFAALALALAAPAAAPALAQTAPASEQSLVGRTVYSADAKPLGVVEKAISAADGRIRQVQVRTRKGAASILRTLPYGSLTVSDKGLVSVLSAAEYEAIPASQTE